MGKRGLTFQQIKEFIEGISGNGCLLITTEEEFAKFKAQTRKQNTKIKINIQCKCGNSYISSYDNFTAQNKRQCNDCGNRNKSLNKTIYDFEHIQRVVNTEKECILLTTKEEFESNRRKRKNSPVFLKLKFKCTCGQSFETNMVNFINKNKTKCNGCSLKNIKDHLSFSYDTIKTQIEKISECILITTREEFNHKLSSTDKSPTAIKIKILCERCKVNTFTTTYNVFNRQTHKHCCNECNLKERGLNSRKDHYKYVEEISEKFGKDEYLILEPYITCDTKLLTRHNCEKCSHHEWRVSPTQLLNNTGCPVCRESRGEFAIRQYLSKVDINFISQYEFTDLISDLKVPLKFDFALFNKDQELVMLLEYDGEQHFKWIKGLMSKSKYNRQKKHDKMKDDYCIKNNIPLLRIPYWDFDKIEDILEESLNSKNSIGVNNQ